MLGIGFWELVLVGFVALLVFGPEQLSMVAKILGRMVGKSQQFLHEIRALASNISNDPASKE